MSPNRCPHSSPGAAYRSLQPKSRALPNIKKYAHAAHKNPRCATRMILHGFQTKPESKTKMSVACMTNYA
jgi:hypothetical protein